MCTDTSDRCGRKRAEETSVRDKFVSRKFPMMPFQSKMYCLSWSIKKPVYHLLYVKLHNARAFSLDEKQWINFLRCHKDHPTLHFLSALGSGLASFARKQHCFCPQWKAEKSTVCRLTSNKQQTKSLTTDQYWEAGISLRRWRPKHGQSNKGFKFVRCPETRLHINAHVAQCLLKCKYSSI